MHSRGPRTFLLCALLAAGAGCDFPRDAAGTLDRVTGGVMRVGVSENAPWVRVDDGRADGVEVALIRAWAERLHARLEWVEGSPAELVEALRRRELDLVLAGLTADSPWKAQVAFTQPYAVVEIVIGVVRGGSAPPAWDGRRVGVAPGRPRVAALVRDVEGVPVPLREKPARRPAAVFDFELAAYGLVPTDAVLQEERHVIAAAPGESAFLLALDKFLQGREPEIRRRLARGASR